MPSMMIWGLAFAISLAAMLLTAGGRMPIAHLVIGALICMGIAFAGILENQKMRREGAAKAEIAAATARNMGFIYIWAATIIALTYMASQKVVPKYNVMGSAKAALEHAVRQLAFELGTRQIRVNAISAGPISTLSARGIQGFTRMAAHHRVRAPLRRNVTAKEVGDAALFLSSDLASGITGEILHVDAGFNVMSP